MKLSTIGCAALAVVAVSLTLACSDDSGPADAASGVDKGVVVDRGAGVDATRDSGGTTPDVGSTTFPDGFSFDRSTDPVGELLGEPCAQHADCGGGQGVCLQGGEWVWPGGYCTMICQVIDNHDPCPVGSHCEELVQTGANIQACIKNCTTDNDCREGYMCAPVPLEDFGGCIVFE